MRRKTEHRRINLREIFHEEPSTRGGGEEDSVTDDEEQDITVAKVRKREVAGGGEEQREKEREVEVERWKQCTHPSPRQHDALHIATHRLSPHPCPPSAASTTPSTAPCRSTPEASPGACTAWRTHSGASYSPRTTTTARLRTTSPTRSAQAASPLRWSRTPLRPLPPPFRKQAGTTTAPTSVSRLRLTRD